MTRNLVKVCGLGALLVCAICMSSEAQAGGRRCACHCQPQYVAPAVTYAAPATGVASSGANTRYQSAYQAPVAAPTYYAPAPAARSRSWDEKSFARHIKGLD